MHIFFIRKFSSLIKSFQSFATVGLLCTGLVYSSCVNAVEILVASVFGGGDFVTIDPTTGQANLLGNPAISYSGLSDVGSTLYGSRNDGFLWEVNPLTGSTIGSSILPGYGTGSEGAMAFDANGNGYIIRGATGDPLELWRFTSNDSSAVLINGNMGGARFDGMDFDARGILYGIDQTSNLFTIDTSTGNRTLIGSTGVTPRTTQGLTFGLDNTLYSLLNENLYTISTTTGAATLVGPTGYNFSVTGFGGLSTINAVPVPAAFWLFGSGLLFLKVMSRRRQ